MIRLIIALLIGIAIGVVYHATIAPWAKRTWEKFRTWRRNSTRQI